ncbi:hypothetical protein HY450_00400 [Candidatus Pacearchaeota archaeon]|nr:hypothetical protein [Candidatus Pacearchaeota archaeon]
MEKEEFYRKIKSKRRIVVLVAILSVLVLYIFRTEYSLIRTIGVIGLLGLFHLADFLFELDFEVKHYFFIILIAIISFPLGSLYLLYTNFDKLMHFIEPIMLSSIIIFMVSKLKIEFKWRLLFVFFIVVGLLGMFEIGEYILDTFFGFRLQGVYIYETTGNFYLSQSKIDDTIIDMTLGILGTASYIVSVALLGKERKKLFRK